MPFTQEGHGPASSCRIGSGDGGVLGWNTVPSFSPAKRASQHCPRSTGHGQAHPDSARGGDIAPSAWWSAPGATVLAVSNSQHWCWIEAVASVTARSCTSLRMAPGPGGIGAVWICAVYRARASTIEDVSQHQFIGAPIARLLSRSARELSICVRSGRAAIHRFGIRGCRVSLTMAPPPAQQPPGSRVRQACADSGRQGGQRSPAGQQHLGHQGPRGVRSSLVEPHQRPWPNGLRRGSC